MSDLIPIEDSSLSKFETWEEANQEKEKEAWKRLALKTVGEEAFAWLSKRKNVETQKAYRIGIKQLHEHGIIYLGMTLQAFSLVNHNSAIDRIREVKHWSKRTQQQRAACYISFTAYLDRESGGMIKKAQPKKTGKGEDNTFYIVSEKVETPKLLKAQWLRYFEVFEKFNLRDALVGKLLLEGGRRINEVLSRDINHINWEANQVRFQISKTGGAKRFKTITYSPGIMERLRQIVGDRNEGPIFITKKGNRVQYAQLIRSFDIAGQRSGIPFKVTTHVMRVSLVSYLISQGFDVGKIMEITGQSYQTVLRYNVQEEENNISKEINCFGN